MNSQGTTPDAASNTPLEDRVLYLEPASLLDVMMEQLEYLVEHRDGNCGSGCPDCARLEQVQSSLLRPFRPAPRPIPCRLPTAA
jgi:hypothetical protein